VRQQFAGGSSEEGCRGVSPRIWYRGKGGLLELQSYSVTHDPDDLRFYIGEVK